MHRATDGLHRLDGHAQLERGEVDQRLGHRRQALARQHLHGGDQRALVFADDLLGESLADLLDEIRRLASGLSREVGAMVCEATADDGVERFLQFGLDAAVEDVDHLGDTERRDDRGDLAVDACLANAGDAQAAGGDTVDLEFLQCGKRLALAHAGEHDATAFVGMDPGARVHGAHGGTELVGKVLLQTQWVKQLTLQLGQHRCVFGQHAVAIGGAEFKRGQLAPCGGLAREDPPQHLGGTAGTPFAPRAGGGGERFQKGLLPVTADGFAKPGLLQRRRK